MDYLMNGIIIVFVLACIVFFYNALKFFELRTQKNNKEVVAMKKYVDWDKIEEETVSAEEACECTRSKLQPLIDFVVELFPKKMESFRGEDAEVIPEKKKPLTKDERLALLGNIEKKLKGAIETYSQNEISYTSDDLDFLSTNRSTVPKKKLTKDERLALIKESAEKKSFDERLRNRGR